MLNCDICGKCDTFCVCLESDKLVMDDEYNAFIDKMIKQENAKLNATLPIGFAYVNTAE